MKTFKIWLLTIVVLLCSTTVNAHDFEVDGIYYNITSETNLTVSVTYKGSDYSSAVYSGNIIIPSSVEYNSIIYSVTVIGSSAFYGCTGLTNITIPNSVTSIWGSAFDGCSNLTSITIPNSVTSIGHSAFDGCSNLTSITIPNSVTDIRGDAFFGCVNLTSIVVEEDNPMYDSRGNCNAIIKTATNELIRGCQSTIIPNSVTSIGHSAFYDCTGLTSITIPDGVTSIGSAAFNGCTGLTSITIPDGVTNIGSSAFNGCSNLASFAIPNSVTSIGGSIFSGCDNLTSIVVEEDNPMYDSRGNCNAIIKTATNELIRGCQSTIIPNSVTSIGSAAFNGCTGLTYLTIPNGVKSIQNNAFNGCKDLISITIPNSVISIGSYAFHNTNLPIENNIRYADTWAVEVTDETKAKYTLRDNTTGIANYAFSYCSNLTSITIPDGVISINY